MTLQEDRLVQIRTFMQEQQLDALALRKVSSFAWATAGHRSYVNTASSDGIGTLVVTADEQFVITNAIEAPRLDQEEGLGAAGWKLRVSPWYQADNTLAQIVSGKRTGADFAMPGATDVSGALAWQRSHLLPTEGDRFRALGKLCAAAMNEAIHSLTPGMTEHEIAARLAFETERRGAQAIVNLIATDERIFQFRHPIPTHHKLDRYAMLVLCGRQDGLVCSITRLIRFGKLTAELRRKEQVVAQIDGTFILGTRPGRTLGDIFADAQAAYAAGDFADQWQYHHQGGPAAYEPREVIAAPGMTQAVVAGQVYAWNPSITGTKSEDTVLVGAAGNEVLTVIDGWPTIDVTVNGQTIARPAILEL